MALKMFVTDGGSRWGVKGGVVKAVLRLGEDVSSPCGVKSSRMTLSDFKLETSACAGRWVFEPSGTMELHELFDENREVFHDLDTELFPPEKDEAADCEEDDESSCGQDDGEISWKSNFDISYLVFSGEGVTGDCFTAGDTLSFHLSCSVGQVDENLLLSGSLPSNDEGLSAVIDDDLLFVRDERGLWIPQNQGWTTLRPDPEPESASECLAPAIAKRPLPSLR